MAYTLAGFSPHNCASIAGNLRDVVGLVIVIDIDISRRQGRAEIIDNFLDCDRFIVTGDRYGDPRLACGGRLWGIGLYNCGTHAGSLSVTCICDSPVMLKGR